MQQIELDLKRLKEKREDIMNQMAETDMGKDVSENSAADSIKAELETVENDIDKLTEMMEQKDIQYPEGVIQPGYVYQVLYKEKSGWKDSEPSELLVTFNPNLTKISSYTDIDSEQVIMSPINTLLAQTVIGKSEGEYPITDGETSAKIVIKSSGRKLLNGEQN